MLMSRKTSGKFPQPQNPSQACRKSLGSTTQPRQTTLENIQHIGELQILVRQGSFCLKRVQTAAHASGSPQVTLSPQREISACPRTRRLFPRISAQYFPPLTFALWKCFPCLAFSFFQVIQDVSKLLQRPRSAPVTMDSNYGVMALKLP